MKCQNCQFDIQDTAKSCPFCNFSVGDAAPETAGDPGAESASPPLPAPEAGAPDPSEGSAPPVPGGSPEGEPQLHDLSDEIAIPDVMPQGPPPSVPEPQPVPPDSPPAADDGFEVPVIPKRSILKILGPLAAACVMGYAGYLFYVPKPTPPPPEDPAPVSTPPAAPIPPAGQPAPGDAAQPDAAPAQPAVASTDPMMVDPRMAAMLESQRPPEEPAEAGEDTAGADGKRPARPAVKQGDVWVFEGTVRDLISFKAVRGAQMLFVSIRNENDFNTTTNSRGLYRVSLPGDAQGYRLMIDHPDYLADYFVETPNRPFRSMPKGSRLQLRSAKPNHEPWLGAGPEPMQRDVFLFPDITD